MKSTARFNGPDCSVTESQWYPSGTSGAADPCQQVNYTYGSDATLYNYNRLVTTNYGSWSGPYYDANGLSGTCVPGANATTYTESYQYNAPGGVASKTLAISRRNLDSDDNVVTNNASVQVSYTYDSAGGMATTAYPLSFPSSLMATLPWMGGYTPVTFSYENDSMGRPVSLTDNLGTSPPAYASTETGSNTNWVSGVTYDYAGRLTSWQHYFSTTSRDCEWDDAVNNSVTETLTYNANSQLLSKNFNGSQESCYETTTQNNGFVYTYPSGNNGQISQVSDTMSGETVSYTYDSLKRLTAASSTPNTGSSVSAWTQNYTYDGFGNMTAIALNGTTITPYTVEPTTNRFTSSYDANGNSLSANGAALVYDEANRVSEATSPGGVHEYYGYAPDNKRIYDQEEWTFYGAHGERLGTFGWYDASGTGDYGYLYPVRSTVWFAGKLVWDGQTGYMAPGAPNQDRVGTNRANGARFYPYGAEITSTANDHEKFATYQRDSLTGIDYADQRYYTSSYGRFNTPDPGRSARLRDPGSWNRYVYASDDPVNRNDPTGKIDCWSWYDVVLNEGGGVIPDETTLGNCADGGGDNTSMEFDPCSVNADVLVALDVPMSCAAPPCYDAENSETCGGSSSGAPSAAQGGGSGAAGAPAVLSSFSFAQLQTQATAALNYELNNLGPNCDKVLPVGTLKSIESFTPLTFWNATTQGGQLASLLGGTNGGANATIGSYFGNGQYAVILNGAGGGFINQVVLGANFYSDPSSQGLTLLHELLHFALQKGDAGIDAHFGINVGVAGASASFSKWLANDCNN